MIIIIIISCGVQQHLFLLPLHVLQGHVLRFIVRHFHVLCFQRMKCDNHMRSFTVSYVTLRYYVSYSDDLRYLHV